MPSPRDDSLFVPSRTAEHARRFVSWPCRPELWDDHLAEAERITQQMPVGAALAP